MHRQLSSSASSVEAMGVNGHAASGEDDAWTRGAAEPGAPRLGMLPSPYASANWRLGSRRWERGPTLRPSSRTSLGEGVAEAQRGARRGALPGGMGLPTTMLRQGLARSPRGPA
ncbi:hypothetical protein L1887_63364 [Cichorium endivia]|nr:hypothetical protein L1887_63364 [Cichorium endivia]